MRQGRWSVLSSGWTNFCARKTSGAVACAGAATLGQLADGGATVATTPVVTIPW